MSHCDDQGLSHGGELAFVEQGGISQVTEGDRMPDMEHCYDRGSLARVGCKGRFRSANWHLNAFSTRWRGRSPSMVLLHFEAQLTSGNTNF